MLVDYSSQKRLNINTHLSIPFLSEYEDDPIYMFTSTVEIRWLTSFVKLILQMVKSLHHKILRPLVIFISCIVTLRAVTYIRINMKVLFSIFTIYEPKVVVSCYHEVYKEAL